MTNTSISPILQTTVKMQSNSTTIFLEHDKFSDTVSVRTIERKIRKWNLSRLTSQPVVYLVSRGATFKQKCLDRPNQKASENTADFSK